MSDLPDLERNASGPQQRTTTTTTTTSTQDAPSRGFALWAEWLSLDPDGDSFVFRKFNKISARNLLYLQCEVLALEHKLERWDRTVDRSRDTDLEHAAVAYEELVSQCEAGVPEAREMMDTIQQLRAKLKEYHEALLLQHSMAKLHRPSRRALKATKSRFKRPSTVAEGSAEKKPRAVLGGRAKTYLDDDDDLVSLKQPVERDYLSRTLRANWKGKEETLPGGFRITRYEERHISLAAGAINILVAAALLIGSMAGLSRVSSREATMGLICALTVVFALSVGVMTSAKRAEIFAATAAYAAVLVVFVGNGGLSGASQE